MGRNTKIDWCDDSWNPVTGCLHECPYCYARGIANRFGSNQVEFPDQGKKQIPKIMHVLEKPMRDEKGKIMPYPYGFDPTFHRYRLGEPQEWKQSRVIFVCSMSDLFGKWVPDSWINEVFDSCKKAPQHKYLFLTKNPRRYIDLAERGLLPCEFWYGYSATRQDKLWTFQHACECPCMNLFVSIEPILEPMRPGFSTHTPADWVIIGAETGNRRGKVIPEKKWIMDIAEECEYSDRPIFMKESLREIMGDDFRQQFPWPTEAVQK